MKFTQALAVMTVLSVASVAQAHVKMNGSSATGSPLHSATPTNFSDSAYVYRMAVIEGQGAAADVINGGAVTDRFLAARAAAETIMGTQFKSEVEAASAILELAESFR